MIALFNAFLIVCVVIIVIMVALKALGFIWALLQDFSGIIFALIMFAIITFCIIKLKGAF